MTIGEMPMIWSSLLQNEPLPFLLIVEIMVLLINAASKSDPWIGLIKFLLSI
jgi:hypothetical protein